MGGKVDEEALPLYRLQDQYIYLAYRANVGLNSQGNLTQF